MKEQLYTIPVNDAFKADCECPLCSMYEALEKNAVEFTLGPSYMEDDIRMETNRTGFCEKHIRLLYREQNRLGLSLMLLTHMEEVINETARLQKSGRVGRGGFLKKAMDSPPAVYEYIKKLEDSCYICDRVSNTFGRYLVTIFHLYHKEDEFRTKFAASKGLCIKHYALLYQEAPNFLKGKELEQFTEKLDLLFLENLKRVRDDLEWYTDKFDYRNADAPWKNSKDAVSRSILKLNGVQE